jgi:2-aminoadipate transaminase
MPTAVRPRPALSAAAGRVPSSTIRDLLALTEDDRVLSLAGGLPAVGHVHDTVLADIAARVLARPDAAQYATTEGWAPLRAWLADGLAADADDVRVTHGSQQALELTVRALVDPGATVVVEQPTYLGAVQALRAADADVRAVPVDADGLDTDRLAGLLAGGLRPRLAYLAPTYQNPSGVVMAPERRAHLGALADRYGFVVVDDDPYRDLGFTPPPPRLRDWVPPELAVTLGSFSKVLAPGLRVGWLHGPGWLVEPLTRLKQAADLHTSTLGQRLVAEAGDRLTFAAPRGGMFLWARLAPAPGGRPRDAASLLPAALARGVAFVPGAAFALADPPADHLRLCFATLPDADLAEAAARLAAALGDAG